MEFDLMLRFWRLVTARPDDEFWALTPREFYAIAALYLPNRPDIDRAKLDDLMRAFPDKEMK